MSQGDWGRSRRCRKARARIFHQLAKCRRAMLQAVSTSASAASNTSRARCTDRRPTLSMSAALTDTWSVSTAARSCEIASFEAVSDGRPTDILANLSATKARWHSSSGSMAREPTVGDLYNTQRCSCVICGPQSPRNAENIALARYRHVFCTVLL